MRAIVRGAELNERVRLIERQQLALPHFPNERLARQRCRADERSERGLCRLPPLDDVGGEIFRITSEVEATDGGPRLVERGESRSLLRCCHV